MILESISLTRCTYGHLKGFMTGRARFSGAGGAVEITLDEGKCKVILDLCAAQIVDTAKGVASNLTAECIESSTSLLT